MRLGVSDAVVAKLVDTHAEFKIVATLPDGTPVVEFVESGPSSGQVVNGTVDAGNSSDALGLVRVKNKQ